MTDPILPSVADPIAHGMAALVAKRPRAAAHVESGRYGDLFAGWSAQESLVLGRLVDAVRARRLPTAEGAALVELAASEFETVVDPAPTRAIGTMTLYRPPGALRAGVIRKDTKVRRLADAASIPTRKDATYVAIEDAYVPMGSVLTDVTVEANEAGAAANIVHSNAPPAADVPMKLQLASTTFDPTWRVLDGDAGGGSDGIADDDVRRMARAFARGRLGPTTSAILAGALLSTGVKHAAVFEDPVRAATRLLVADASWAGSTLWARRIRQRLYDAFVGFGCKVMVDYAQNRFIAVSATIRLRDASFRYDAAGIAEAALRAARRYLDDRPDWYTFRLSALRAALARCDRRVLTCERVAVTSAWDGAPVAEPIAPAPGHVLYEHFWLADDALSLDIRDPR
jgi:hypothetical protein